MIYRLSDADVDAMVMAAEEGWLEEEWRHEEEDGHLEDGFEVLAMDAGDHFSYDYATYLEDEEGE